MVWADALLFLIWKYPRFQNIPSLFHPSLKILCLETEMGLGRGSVFIKPEDDPRIPLTVIQGTGKSEEL